MDTTGRFILWLFLAPDDWVSDRLGVTADQIRDLMRMLVDSLFSIVVAVIGPAIWTSGLPMYQQTGADLPVNSRPLFQLELMGVGTRTVPADTLRPNEPRTRGIDL